MAARRQARVTDHELRGHQLFKSSSWRALGYTVLFALLIAGLIFLATRARPIDPSSYNEIVGTLRDLKQLNADWDVAVLRTRIGDETGHDRVSGPLPDIAKMQERVVQTSAAYWSALGDADAGRRLKPLEDKLAVAFQAKIDAVAQYKSHNATLLSSAHFLPTAAMQMSQAAAASDMSADNQAKLWQASNALLAGAMGFIQAPSDALRSRLTRSVASITMLTRGESESVSRAGTALAEHVHIVLNQQDLVRQLLAQVAALPVAKAIDELTDAEAAENQRVLAATQQYQLWLEIYAGFLVVVLLLLVWRLLAIFRALGRSHADLERSNRELRDSQMHLVQSEKMSSLGQMVAGIAHEINTPLAYVKGTFAVLREQTGVFRKLAQDTLTFTRMMREPYRDQRQMNAQFRAVESASQVVAEGQVLHEIETLLTEGIHGMNQISDIIANLRNFSRLDREKVTSFSVEQGLDNTLMLARNMLQNTIDVRKDYGHVLSVPGSPSQINQVFLNIITNAAHAMPALGERPGPNVITLRTRMAGNKTVRIDIQDNGKGIPENVLPKIFDPFFTTKPVGRGTGLGLSISYKIVEEHGGRILVDSREGKGTTFSILLPVDPDTRVSVPANLTDVASPLSVSKPGPIGSPGPASKPAPASRPGPASAPQVASKAAGRGKFDESSIFTD